MTVEGYTFGTTNCTVTVSAAPGLMDRVPLYSVTSNSLLADTLIVRGTEYKLVIV